jgi:hypothetical protein
MVPISKLLGSSNMKILKCLDNQGISPARKLRILDAPGAAATTAYPIGASPVDVSAISRQLAQIDIAAVAKLNRERRTHAT